MLVSLTYLPQAERLNVGVIEARNLKALSTQLEAGLFNIDSSRRMIFFLIDTVVRLTLQLGQTDKVKRKKTGVKRNTLNPKWNEEISFNISGVSLAESSLEIGVYHHDLIAPDEPLGFLRFENVTPITSANIAQHSEIIHCVRLSMVNNVQLVGIYYAKLLEFLLSHHRLLIKILNQEIQLVWQNNSSLFSPVFRNILVRLIYVLVE